VHPDTREAHSRWSCAASLRGSWLCVGQTHKAGPFRVRLCG
jgi:hypothetical protein